VSSQVVTEYTAIRGKKGQPAASLYGCDTMRELYPETRTCQPSRTRTAARRRRLARGVARWAQVNALDSLYVRRAAEITLTMDTADYEAAEGKAREFWARVRDLWPGVRYFCWLELQRSGRLHYHALWLNPPHRSRVDLVRWVTHAWGAGRTRTRFHDAAWMRRQGTDYVLSYAKKIGDKSYQQDYEAVPSTLRTFMTQRLGYGLTDLDEHRDRPLVQYVPESVHAGELVPEHLVIVGTARHCPSRTGCAVTPNRFHRRSRPQPAARGPGRRCCVAR